MNRVLIQCQQSIEVPEISIEIDPRVKILCEQNSNSLDINPDKQLVDDLVVQMTHWIQDVMTLTEMKWDSTQGNSATGEINYWITYERALSTIN